MVDDRPGAAARLPVLRDRSPRTCATARPTRPTRRCGRRCGSPPADGFVSAHPDGLDMPVAQGGINFSGGQRQRLAIARAVIRRPADLPVRRRVLRARRAHRRAGPRRPARGVGRRDGRHRLATHLDGRRGRPDRRHRRRRRGGHRHARVAARPTARSTPSSPTRSRSAERRPASTPAPGARMTRPMRRTLGGVSQAPTERSRDFKGSAVRLVKRLTPQRVLTASVLLLGIVGHRDRGDRPAHPRARHRPVVQRRDRPRAARGDHQGAGDRGRKGPRRRHLRRPAVRA